MGAKGVKFGKNVHAHKYTLTQRHTQPLALPGMEIQRTHTFGVDVLFEDTRRVQCWPEDPLQTCVGGWKCAKGRERGEVSGLAVNLLSLFWAMGRRQNQVAMRVCAKCHGIW